MTRTPTPIETVKASEARQHFSELVNRVHETGARVMIEKNGVVVGGLVSREDMRRLRYLDEKTAAANEAMIGFRPHSPEFRRRKLNAKSKGPSPKFEQCDAPQKMKSPRRPRIDPGGAGYEHHRVRFCLSWRIAGTDIAPRNLF